MTHPEFRDALMRLGMSQSGFAREVSRLADQTLALRTVQNYATAQRPIPPAVAALVKTMLMLKGVQP